MDLLIAQLGGDALVRDHILEHVARKEHEEKFKPVLRDIVDKYWKDIQHRLRLTRECTRSLNLFLLYETGIELI